MTDIGLMKLEKEFLERLIEYYNEKIALKQSIQKCEELGIM